ncbi:MAG TPA: glutamine synthetase family protein [Rhizomicrobium sp.]|jgi:glutamine synthetase|nr:glutamine synthetase family protein [Rhizomicrobium sp.]
MNKPATAPAFPRPAFVAEAEAEFDAFFEAETDLEFLDAVIPDLCGTPRGKRFPIAEAQRLFAHGMPIPLSIYLMDARGDMADTFGRGFSDGDPDGTAWPLPDTLSRVWTKSGPPRAQMLMTLRDKTGAPDPGEPRAALERVLERFADTGLVPVTALELEFYLLDPSRGEHRAPQPPLDPRTGARESAVSVFGLDDLDRYEGFLSALSEAARRQRVPLSAASKEYAPGQFEANLKHQSDARLAADHAIFLKQIVKEAARANGFEATFMAKPYLECTGSGLHIHLSILDREGRNIFAGADEAGSELLRHAIGGLQALMAESMAIFAPNQNSYRRFQPDMFAPVNRSWGINNRSAGMRIPSGPDESRRVEHRVAGADANPYLALAAVLAGVHHGLLKKLDPGAPAKGNVSKERDPDLPFSIDDALGKLAMAEVLPAYLGEETLALYRETKRIETVRLRRIIPPVEYDWYL